MNRYPLEPMHYMRGWIPSMPKFNIEIEYPSPELSHIIHHYEWIEVGDRPDDSPRKTLSKFWGRLFIYPGLCSPSKEFTFSSNSIG